MPAPPASRTLPPALASARVCRWVSSDGIRTIRLDESQALAVACLRQRTWSMDSNRSKPEICRDQGIVVAGCISTHHCRDTEEAKREPSPPAHLNAEVLQQKKELVFVDLAAVVFVKHLGVVVFRRCRGRVQGGG